MKIKTTDFGEFIFLDDTTVVARANSEVTIDGAKVREAISMIEHELPAAYALILDRKHDYAVVPIEVYQYLSSLPRLKAIAIVRYKMRDFLPENMERKLFTGELEKFTSIDDAHIWARGLFSSLNL